MRKLLLLLTLAVSLVACEKENDIAAQESAVVEVEATVSKKGNPSTAKEAQNNYEKANVIEYTTEDIGTFVGQHGVEVRQVVFKIKFDRDLGVYAPRTSMIEGSLWRCVTIRRAHCMTDLGVFETKEDATNFLTSQSSAGYLTDVFGNQQVIRVSGATRDVSFLEVGDEVWVSVYLLSSEESRELTGVTLIQRGYPPTEDDYFNLEWSSTHYSDYSGWSGHISQIAAVNSRYGQGHLTVTHYDADGEVSFEGAPWTSTSTLTISINSIDGNSHGHVNRSASFRFGNSYFIENITAYTTGYYGPEGANDYMRKRDLISCQEMQDDECLSSDYGWLFDKFDENDIFLVNLYDGWIDSVYIVD